jgi:pilus assembly protein CpaB
MKSKSLVLLAVAAGCGLVGMLGVQQMLSQNRGQAVQMATVLVAQVEIEPGIRLTPDLVQLRELPANTVPQDAVTKTEDYDDRSLKNRAFPGQIIVSAQLSEKGEHGISVKIPDGMRMYSLPVNSTMIHSGLMKPGDRVDVILSYEVSSRTHGREKRTKTILEYIEVLAMGTQQEGVETPTSKGAPTKVENVSVLLTPRQVEMVAFADSLGELQLSVRSRTDKVPANPEGTTESQIDSLFAELQGAVNPAQQSAATVTAEQTPAAPDDRTTNATNTVPPNVKSDFGAFIKNAMSQMQAAEAAKPKKTTWKIEIYQGQERHIEEVEISEATKLQKSKDQHVKSTPVTGSVGGSWNPWKLFQKRPAQD